MPERVCENCINFHLLFLQTQAIDPSTGKPIPAGKCEPNGSPTVWGDSACVNGMFSAKDTATKQPVTKEG